MDVKSYRVIVEELDVRDSSTFLSDINIQGCLALFSKQNILSFESIDQAVNAAKIHADNWWTLHRKSNFGYSVVPVYEDDKLGDTIKRYERGYLQQFREVKRL